MERLVEEYSDTEVFQNFENISVDTDLICLDADHTNYSILIQLAKKGVDVSCRHKFPLAGNPPVKFIQHHIR